MLYDADCGFCRWAVERIVAWDTGGRVTPVPIQGPLGATLLASLSPEQRLASWHLITAEGRLYSAGEAIPPLLRLLPGGRKVAAVAAMFPRATERLYRAVADRRAGLGRALRATGRLRQQRVP